jgi:hypothetical protein
VETISLVEESKQWGMLLAECTKKKYVVVSWALNDNGV